MYKNHIRKVNPGLLIITLDQSHSMSESMPNGEGSIAKNVADAIKALEEYLEYCYSYENPNGIEFEDVPCYMPIYFFIVGYGSGKAYIIYEEWINPPLQLGSFSDVLYPVAKGDPVMINAFNMVKKKVEHWKTVYCSSEDLAPLIINVTAVDDISDPEIETIAKDIMQIQFPDGNPILFNIHLASKDNSIIEYPEDEPRCQETFSKRLYASSSVINEDLKNRIQHFFSKRLCGEESRMFVNVKNPRSLYMSLGVAAEYFCAHRPRYKDIMD